MNSNHKTYTLNNENKILRNTISNQQQHNQFIQNVNQNPFQLGYNEQPPHIQPQVIPVMDVRNEEQFEEIIPENINQEHVYRKETVSILTFASGADIQSIMNIIFIILILFIIIILIVVIYQFLKPKKSNNLPDYLKDK